MINAERVKDAIQRIRGVQWEKNYGVSQVHFEDILLCATVTQLWLDEQESNGGNGEDRKRTDQSPGDTSKG